MNTNFIDITVRVVRGKIPDPGMPSDNLVKARGGSGRAELQPALTATWRYGADLIRWTKSSIQETSGVHILAPESFCSSALVYE